MMNSYSSNNNQLRVMVFGVGAFTHGVLHILKQHGAEVSTYLIRDYAHYSPSLEGETFLAEMYPNPCKLLKEKEIDFVVPMSIDWQVAEWAEEFLSMNIPILSPTGQGMQLERDRDFARALCEKYQIPFPKAFVAQNLLQAENLVNVHPLAYVIKNPLCSPSSPIQTIICETVADTLSWLKRVNYEEGVFLQEYMGQKEAGHIAFVSGGEIDSLISNQEYKRAFDGNMGIAASAPLGGIVEKDPEDKYNLARELIHPLLPWFREVGFHGPVQVTAIRKDNKWFVLEYNVRTGVMCTPIILRMLKEPLNVLWDVVRNQEINASFEEHLNFGCSVTLAGYGYPYPQVKGPPLPIQISQELDCDLWWNEVAVDSKGVLHTTGQRIVDVVAVESTLDEAILKAYENIGKIRCLNSYYRTDIGQSLWPPGND